MLRTGMLLAERYEILQQIGSGGMAYVYRAIDHKLNRYVAIKVLKEEYCKDKSFVAKFRMEAQAAAGLSHTNIVGVYDVGEVGSIYYIVMELIEGITLKEYIARKRKLGVKETIGVAIQVAQGLEAAHSRHLVHRDIKPQNIIISRDGKIKVTDFGIARAITDETTNMYKAAGSVHYISPEQARGGYCDERSDIYSLGITMYEMVTGRVPFDGDTTVAVAIAHMNEAIIPPSQFEPSIPLALEQIIFKCVQKKPDRRYASCQELIADLRQAIVTPQDGFVRFAPVDEEADQEMRTDEGERSYARGREQQPVSQNTIQMTPIQTYSKKREVQYDDDEYEDAVDFSNPATRKGGTGSKESAGRKVQPAARREPPRERSQIQRPAPKSPSGQGPARRPRPEKEETGTWFDRLLVWAGGIFGIVILGMAVYICVMMAGILSPKKSSGLPSQTPEITTAEETATTHKAKEGETLSDRQTKVPNLLGCTLEEAQNLIEDAGLVYVNSNKYEYSDEYEAGTVCAQRYAEGTIIDKGSKITVTLSMGSDKLDFDGTKYLNSNVSVLKYVLNSYSGINVEYIETESETTKKDTILKLEPEQGKLGPGDTLKVYISKGPTQVAVTDLTGMTKAQAISALSKLGLTLGTVSTDYNNWIDADLVCGQSVPVGTVVAVGSSVNITISLGRKSVEVPYVIGMTEADATATLNGKGLSCNSVWETNDSSPAGTVIAQSVAAGTWVTEWTNVTITISAGPASVVVDQNAVMNKPQDEAVSYVASLGLNYQLSYENSSWVPAGNAIRVDLPWGQDLHRGDTVTIVISLGAPATEAPPATGAPATEAPPADPAQPTGWPERGGT